MARKSAAQQAIVLTLDDITDLSEWAGFDRTSILACSHTIGYENGDTLCPQRMPVVYTREGLMNATRVLLFLG